MSSLQLISHRLFASAIGRSNSESESEMTCEAEDGSAALTLEVLDSSEPLTELTARPLLTPSIPGAS
jgi:hypothetical protein